MLCWWKYGKIWGRQCLKKYENNTCSWKSWQKHLYSTLRIMSHRAIQICTLYAVEMFTTMYQRTIIIIFKSNYLGEMINQFWGWTSCSALGLILFLCSESFGVMLSDFMKWGIKIGLVSCKVSSIPTILSFQSQYIHIE